MRLILVLLVGLAACVDTERLPTPSKDNSAPLDAGLAAWSEPRGSAKPEVAAPLSVSAGSSAHERVDASAAAGNGQPVVAAASMQPSAAGMGMAMAAFAAGTGGAVVPAASPPALPLPTRTGELVITELMIDPKMLSDSAGEWFELYNPNTYELDLRGCEIDDGAKNRHELTTSLRAPAQRYITIARQSTPGFAPDGVAPISLGNSADSVALRCAGVEIDRVSYDKAAGYTWASGASLSLDAERLDARSNDSASAWCAGRDS
ncbi:MAG: hypothetical protein RL701_6474, partial [Pseudomonadota bacterium]